MTNAIYVNLVEISRLDLYVNYELKFFIAVGKCV